jgi:hypothetical protein
MDLFNDLVLSGARVADSPNPKRGTLLFSLSRFSPALAACLLACTCSVAQEGRTYAEIRVTDAATGRGVPLVELETVNGLRFITDNAGRVAFHEPGLMDHEIYFSVRSHGYEAK